MQEHSRWALLGGDLCPGADDPAIPRSLGLQLTPPPPPSPPPPPPLKPSQGVVCPGDVDFIGNAITSLKRDGSMQISNSFALTDIEIGRRATAGEACIVEYKNATGATGNATCFEVQVNGTGIAYVGGQKLLFHASGSYSPSNTLSCGDSALTLTVCLIGFSLLFLRPVPPVCSFPSPHQLTAKSAKSTGQNGRRRAPAQ